MKNKNLMAHAADGADNRRAQTALTGPRARRRVALILSLIASAAGASAQQTFSTESGFQAALSGTTTVVNLDDGVLGALPVPYNVEDANAAAAFANLGIDFILNNVEVAGGQAIQIPKPDRDRLIVHGAGNNGDITFNLLTPISGIGAWANIGDGGRVRAFSEPDLGGVLLGEVPFGGASDFGGLVVAGSIASVEITCEFNEDLRCGVFDIQFGTAPETDGDGVPDAADNCVWIPNPDQRDSNGDGFGNACDADLNDDCVVNVVDLGILRTVFFSGDADADLNGDGVVNVVDLGVMRTRFFLPPGPSGVTGVCD